ncbi:MAG: aromatic ring-hydroxylating dioxygenase subunit alpha [Cyanobacteria bacterium SID2]|nr:aromatic ring-hydroxylating dioxygenase subunit alpha [Cyanobacteria bacterium SID2]MBP0004113.1 aromatic ring-hydroxylating dioxygenase subunit alpha [Cyanobacteria bacterium SBC]
MSDCSLVRDWHPVLEVDALPPGTVRSIRLLGRDLVLWRSIERDSNLTSNPISTWIDRCPHRGVKLSGGTVKDNVLVCPYHGLQFDETGHCVKVPGCPNWNPPEQLKVSSYPTAIRYGLIWVCLQPESNPSQIPPFPEWDASQYRKFLCGGYRIRSSSLRVMENFLDVSHFPFVHDGFLGDRSHPEVEDYQVELDKTGLALKNVRVWQPDPDGTGIGAKVTYNYHVWQPLVTSFEKLSPSGRLTIFFAIRSIDPESCIGWMWIAMNYGEIIPESELRSFQDSVVRQDIPIVESQQPKRLPLNLTEEFHLPFDRSSVRYRQWLKQRGVTFGAIADDRYYS